LNIAHKYLYVFNKYSNIQSYTFISQSAPEHGNMDTYNLQYSNKNYEIEIFKFTKKWLSIQ